MNKLWVLLCVSLLSCAGKNGKMTTGRNGFPDAKETYLNGLKVVIDSAFAERPPQKGDTVRAYVIIPGTGCPGCISSGESLLMTFLKDKLPVRFLLTSLTSYKILKLKLGDSIVNNYNVFVDRENAVIRKVDPGKQAYPLIVYNDQRDDKLVNFEYVEPGNPDAIAHLYQYVNGKF
jgi:hypothetical protein